MSERPTNKWPSHGGFMIFSDSEKRPVAKPEAMLVNEHPAEAARWKTERGEFRGHIEPPRE